MEIFELKAYIQQVLLVFGDMWEMVENTWYITLSVPLSIFWSTILYE